MRWRIHVPCGSTADPLRSALVVISCFLHQKNKFVVGTVCNPGSQPMTWGKTKPFNAHANWFAFRGKRMQMNTSVATQFAAGGSHRKKKRCGPFSPFVTCYSRIPPPRCLHNKVKMDGKPTNIPQRPPQCLCKGGAKTAPPPPKESSVQDQQEGSLQPLGQPQPPPPPILSASHGSDRPWAGGPDVAVGVAAEVALGPNRLGCRRGAAGGPGRVRGSICI